MTVQQKAMSLGIEGEHWLRDLGEVIQLLEQRWKIRIGPSLNGGSEAFVSEVTTECGGQAILKLSMPSMEGNTVFEQEIAALSIADGEGYARLLNHDLNHRGVLLEKLGSPLKDLGYSMETQIEIICKTLKKSWGKSIPKDHKLQTSKDVINWFANFVPELWAELNSPCSRQLIDKALEFLSSRLSHSSIETSVLIHGDAHSGNILQDNIQPHTSFKLIDPDGLVAEPAYDLGVLMREWLDDLSNHPLKNGWKRCLFLSEKTDVDPRAIWEWGLIQSVSTGLFLIKTGQEAMGLQMLTIAEAWEKG
ncbi:streptomycin 6-kinase [Pullulanibacillus pueri]|nr:aminoglycoside phosphotransferase family protein [Pullulanibacillus pueri]MBM7683344.1 streptomycin 6-kinase [Pullulanibacillus pueri]